MSSNEDETLAAHNHNDDVQNRILCGGCVVYYRMGVLQVLWV